MPVGRAACRLLYCIVGGLLAAGHGHASEIERGAPRTFQLETMIMWKSRLLSPLRTSAHLGCLTLAACSSHPGDAEADSTEAAQTVGIEPVSTLNGTTFQLMARIELLGTLGVTNLAGEGDGPVCYAVLNSRVGPRALSTDDTYEITDDPLGQGSPLKEGTQRVSETNATKYYALKNRPGNRGFDGSATDLTADFHLECRGRLSNRSRDEYEPLNAEQTCALLEKSRALIKVNRPR